ncbi:MAG: DUF1611 domain-containing protein [Pseudomonadota bacterium]
MTTLYNSKPIAIYVQGYLDKLHEIKMGIGILMFSESPITCVIDHQHAGQNIQDIIPILPRNCPIVSTVAEAKKLGAESIVLGTATLGGKMPKHWISEIDDAIKLGLSVINGLHDKLSSRAHDLQPGQQVVDLRQEPDRLATASGAAAKLNNKRVLLIGTDMCIGKMTSGLLLHSTAKKMGFNSEFLATGQIGIAICGKGIALDAIRLDFAAGAVEQLVLDNPSDIVFIEGQGSLLHPSSSATLPLLRGSCPTHLVLCHRVNKQTLDDFPQIQIPELNDLIHLYESLASTCGTFPRPKTIALCFNTAELETDEQACQFITAVSKHYGLLATDPVRYSCEDIVRNIMDQHLPSN